MANKQSSPSPKHSKRSGSQADQGSYSVPETIKIYTDWANHYLEKARNKKFITDLQHDIADGVLLAEVIEAVTNEKIRDIKPKPKNSAQMVENINTCLTFLAGLGVSVEGLSAKDIKDGNLKAILGLFFSLSRYKQQQKTQQSQKQGDREPSSKDPQQQPPQQQQVSVLRSQCSTGSSSVAIDSEQVGSGGKAAQQLNGGEMISRLPSPFRQGHASKGGPAAASSTPCKETALSTAQLNARNSRAATAAAAAPAPVATTGDKSRSHGNQQNNNVAAWNTGSSLAPPRSSAQGSSGVQPRATSPGAAPASGIPTPVGRGRPGSGGDKQSNRTSASSTSSTSSSKSSSSKPSTSSSSSGNKNSMLDKFKFFNKDKDKKGGTKSASKASSSSRSEAESRGGSCDVKSSASAPGSSPSESSASLASTVDGACAPASSAAPAGKGSSSSSSAKSGKKSLVRAFSTKREHTSSGGGVSSPGEEHVRQASPGPSPAPPGLVLASPSASASVLSGNSPALGRKISGAAGSRAERGDPRLGQPSPTPSKKGSKLGSFIPTSKPSSSASSSGKGSKSSSGPPLDIVGLTSSSSAPTTPSVPPPPLPSTIPTGIPKPQGRSGGKSSKEEKSRGGSSSREHKSLFGGQSGSGSQRGLPSSSSKTSLQQPQPQPQQQVQVPLTQQQLQRHHQQLQQLQLQQLKQQQQQHHHHHQSRGQHYEHSVYPELQQQQQPTSPSFSTFSSVPGNFHIPGYANIFQQQQQQQQQLQQHSTPTSPTSSQPSRLPPSNSSHSVQSGHARVNVQSLERGEVLGPGSTVHARSLERHAKESTMSLHDVSDRSAFSPTSSTAAHYVPVTIPAAGLEGHGKVGLGRIGGERGLNESLPHTPLMSPSPSRHGVSPTTTAINVVKPTCSTSQSKATKTDSNTQTNLSVLKRSTVSRKSEGGVGTSGGGKGLGLERSSPKLDTGSGRNSPRVEERTSPKLYEGAEKSGGGGGTKSVDVSRDDLVAMPDQTCASSPSVTRKQLDPNGSGVKPVPASEFSYAAQERNMGSPTTISSPKLGVKMLNSHLGKPANNVAIVQPRHGEKIETTFDAEVRSESKSSLGKETVFSSHDEKTTFVDDAGEAMDIKPMPPIMRALPYGYFRGYSGYSAFSGSRNFHIPGISVPTSVYPARTQSQGLGVNRPLMEPAKFYSGHIKRANSNCPSVNNDTDYSSDLDTYDYVSGYMSDGDILKSNRGDDWASGYLSEGGASLYARRLQQRFREGMQAVRECMQKSSGLMDDDSLSNTKDRKSNCKYGITQTIGGSSYRKNMLRHLNYKAYKPFVLHFDDSSSISSGDISDTIAEISTDENLTGSSQGALSDTNVYSSLKRAPRDLTQAFHAHGGSHLQQSGKRTPNLGTSAFMGTDYHSDSGIGGGPGAWRKYSLPQTTNKLLSSDPSDYAYPYSSNGYGGWSTRSEQDYSSLRKLSTASHPEFSPRGDSGYGDSERTLSQSERGFSPSPGGSKRDSETNTDQSHLLETSMRRMQTARGGNGSSSGQGGSGGGSGGGGFFGYRRPLSNTSTSSLGSAKSSSSKGSSVVGSRLAKHGMEGVTQMVRSGSDSVAHSVPTGIPRPSSAASTARSCHSDMGPESYNSSTLERKRKGGLTPSKSTGIAQTDRDFQSNSLGRRRLFGSKSSLSNKSGENGNLCNSTIISNPHATYGKLDSSGKNISHYVNLQELHARQLQQMHQQQQQYHHQHPHSSNYVPLEYPSASQRHSGGSATGGPVGPSLWQRGANGHVPAPAPSQEGESMEALALAAPSIQQQIQQARALSGASARILQQHREALAALSASQIHSPCPSPSHGGPSSPAVVGLQRSSSIKSTLSDSPYAAVGTRTKHSSFSEDIHLPRTGSFSGLSSPTGTNFPSSPTPSNSSHSSRFTYPMTFVPSGSLGGGVGPGTLVQPAQQLGLPYTSLSMSKLAQGKDEEGSRLSKSSTMDYAYFSDYACLSSVHGSNLSLVSTSSSVYSSSEEKHAAEVRKLKRDLEAAQAKVHTLTSQLSTNAHVVSAFEQSLANMTARLQALTTSAEQKVQVPHLLHKSSIKDSELNDLRMTIEALKRQSGLAINDPIISPASSRRHTSPAMVPKDLHGVVADIGGIARQMSSDSVSSINSLSSACSMTSQQSAATDGDAGKKGKNGKKKGWLRSSFSKAFSGKKGKKTKTGSLSDVEPDTHSIRSNASAPNSPLMQIGHLPNGGSTLKGSHSSGALSDADVSILKQQLREKDAKLTDIRLEALSSAHQLEQLRETMTKMKNEMSALKADNDRLHKLMSASRTFNFSQSSLTHTRASNDSLDRSLSLTDQSSLDMLLAETAANDRDGKRVTITVYQGSNPDPSRPGLEKPAEVLIGSLSVSGKTKWDILDNIVRKIFKEYVLRVDPVTNLGLSAESVFSYHIGEITRTKDSEVPELLPIGYLVGDTTQIGICLKGTKQQSVDSLAFETMIPKSIVQRYVSLLLEHRRIILCGPSGTGKTYLAQKLAEHLVLRSGRELTAGCVAVFNVDHKSAKELRQYLANIADQCEATSANALPSVIILDNLHHVASLADVFNGFLTAKYQKCPYIIGTMNQSTCSTTNLQLHHNFRWVLCANHMEPVKGFLGRYLRRKLVEAEVRTGMRNNDLNRIIDWIPKVWAHINKFLETHSSSDITIGPRLFLSCPMDIAGSQVWFTDLWNYSVVPYILEAVRDGLQVYGRRAPWEDPTDWSLQTYPWANVNPGGGPDRSLLHIRPEDVGYDTIPPSSPSTVPALGNTKTPLKGENPPQDPVDPLVNMLMKLQEAASYSGTHSNDSDSTSIGSHSSIQEFSTTSGVESTL